MTKAFLKDLKETSKPQKELNVQKLIASNFYLRNWRKLTSISFNKRDTYKLAKSYQIIKPEYSLYQAKLAISQYKWWDYGYFINLISSFDSQTANKIEHLINEIDAGGKTQYIKQSTSAYKQQLDARSQEIFSEKNIQADGSISFSNDDKNKYPLLKLTEKEISKAKSEIKEEKTKLGQILALWFKNNQKYHNFFILYLEVWAHNYNRYAMNMNSLEVGKQLLRTKNDLLSEKWLNLAHDFEYLMNWWD